MSPSNSNTGERKEIDWLKLGTSLLSTSIVLFGLTIIAISFIISDLGGFEDVDPNSAGIILTMLEAEIIGIIMFGLMIHNKLLEFFGIRWRWIIYVLISIVIALSLLYILKYVAANLVPMPLLGWAAFQILMLVTLVLPVYINKIETYAEAGIFYIILSTVLVGFFIVTSIGILV